MRIKVTITAADVDGERIEADDNLSFEDGRFGEFSVDEIAQTRGKKLWASLYGELATQVHYAYEILDLYIRM